MIFMIPFQELEGMTTEELKDLLLSDFSEQRTLTADTILLVCDVLLQRNPVKRDAHAAFQRFLEACPFPDSASGESPS